VLTDKDYRIENNRITCLGKPLSELPPGRHALALILFVKVSEINERVRRDLNTHVLSCNRLGGVMARMASGRIWLRISQTALTNGLTLDTVGSHILRQIHTDPDRYESAEVMFVVGNQNQVEHLRPVAEEQAQARSERYQYALAEKMACETGLDCDQCPEAETCKVLRKAVAATRKKMRDEG
jgi:CO dehydrogenase/acetyl-CoA synthase beta subunit